MDVVSLKTIFTVTIVLKDVTASSPTHSKLFHFWYLDVQHEFRGNLERQAQIEEL
jgi:hypothetical protein